MSEDFLSGYDEKQIKSAIKLQKLVKEWSKDKDYELASFAQELLKESEK